MDKLNIANIEIERLTKIITKYDEDIKYFDKMVESVMLQNEQRYEYSLKELTARNECLQLRCKQLTTQYLTNEIIKMRK